MEKHGYKQKWKHGFAGIVTLDCQGVPGQGSNRANHRNGIKYEKNIYI